MLHLLIIPRATTKAVVCGEQQKADDLAGSVDCPFGVKAEQVDGSTVATAALHVWATTPGMADDFLKIWRPAEGSRLGAASL
jgi:hypothetical protein